MKAIKVIGLSLMFFFCMFAVVNAQYNIQSLNGWTFVAALQSADTNLTKLYISDTDNATQGTHCEVFGNYGMPRTANGPGYIQLDIQWGKHLSQVGYFAKPDTILFDLKYLGSVNAQMLWASIAIEDETYSSVLQSQAVSLIPGWQHIKIWSGVAFVYRVANIYFDFAVVPPDSSFCGATFAIDNLRFIYIKNGISDTVLVDGFGDSVITGINDHKSSLPTHYALYQNYPNPFNPSTTITYALSAPGDVTLSIYDILGRKITDLISSYQSTGNHTAVWNASRFPSGVYVYVLSINGQLVDRKKMLFLK